MSADPAARQPAIDLDPGARALIADALARDGEARYVRIHVSRG